MVSTAAPYCWACGFSAAAFANPLLSTTSIIRNKQKDYCHISWLGLFLLHHTTEVQHLAVLLSSWLVVIEFIAEAHHGLESSNVKRLKP
jgi:hypothetical protein